MTEENVLVIPAKGKWVFDATKRRYIYRIANVGVLIAVGYNLITGDKGDLWLLLINAILGLADQNVPTVNSGVAPEVNKNNEDGVDRRPNDTLF